MTTLTDCSSERKATDVEPTKTLAEGSLLPCAICSKNPIPAPRDCTTATRFLCRECCRRIARRKSLAECREFKAKLEARLEHLATRAALLTRGIPKTPVEPSPQVVETVGKEMAS
jgi:hypothetical protein